MARWAAVFTMIDRLVRTRRLLAGVAVVSSAVLAACVSPTHRAPVEDRSPLVTRPAVTPAAAAAVEPVTPAPAATAAVAVPVPVAPSAEATRTPPGIENLGKPGYYAVKPGDTVLRIALESGQNWRDIVRWNNLADANVIEVGQVLRVVPPGVTPPRPVEAATRPGAASAPGVTLPAATAPAAPAPAVAAAPPPVTAPATGTPPSAAVGTGDEDIRWSWPATGPVVAGFDEGRTKGLAIGGRAGDPVLAAADGRVVYAGSGLRGYGNLVIVKHNNTFLTAYAHNQALMVKEDQVVRRGQKIAEMGSSDAERVQLHFEIRRQGRPVDPARLLPAR
jgi:lipoprotein NlpD